MRCLTGPAGVSWAARATASELALVEGLRRVWLVTERYKVKLEQAGFREDSRRDVLSAAIYQLL